jgi:hypothetical protein
MPFSCTLPTYEPEVSGQTLAFAIGSDEAASYTVVMGFVLLNNDTHAEFYFAIWRFNEVTELETPLYSGKLTKAFIPEKEDRTLIIEAVCSAIPLLLEQLRPEWVLRITNDQNLPSEALAKHHAIAKAFESCGYETHEVKDRSGCKAWWMWRGNDSLPVQEVESN